MHTVVVGMSGGVDSSVSALLLKQQGFRVIGLFMKNWDEVDEQGVCTSTKDFEDVVKVCKAIDIPYYTVNFVKEYQEHVFDQFLHDFKQGYTPNPDILCNREIKFKLFLEKALELGADFLATGHYCQNILSEQAYGLVRGKDPSKDQSYFLYTIGQHALQKVLFPIGHLLKSQVRQIAKEYGLSTSEKKDSTGICFIGERNFKKFLTGYVGILPGDFETLEGKKVGQHDGFAYYTIGQRKGLNIGGPGEAWFVVGKDIPRNVVFVEQGSDHPALYGNTLIAKELSWIAGEAPPLPYKCTAKIRYRQEDQKCILSTVTAHKEKVAVTFTTPQRAITIGQSIVFYQGEYCLGGGIISEAAGCSKY